MDNYHIRYQTILLLALLTAFPPLSTDMYLPAIPLLEKTWHQPLSIINLTLVAFFISYCVSLLVYGPLSDRFGRRPPLLAGIGIFIAASIACAFSTGIYMLIVFRVLQAAGAASASALALAVTKDIYEGTMREKVLAYIGVIMALAPMMAPVFGGWIMYFFSWRWIFIGQAACGLVAWIGVYRMEETLKVFAKRSALKTAGIYLELFRNRKYMGFALLISLVIFPHFAFIAGSSDIYITGFGLSEQQFGLYFALNAAAIMAGSYACTRLLRTMASENLIALSFAGVLLGGLIMVSRIIPGPFGLTMPMALISFCFGLSRPPSNNLVLDQVDEHAGAASSLLIFIYFILGAVSMWLISLEWADKIMVIGCMGAVSGGTVLLVWSLIPKHLKQKKSA